MSLEAQIQLITVPQEFSRLCNAVLAAEYGDDFLPIDDDRPDRGNDGYLKSEKRVFAVHCFKRVQNQNLDKLIRQKMVGDLGKAIALKNEGLWNVEAWTFLSNYPVDEETGRRALQMGNEAGIDVSWRGPDFIAWLLQENPSVQKLFPALQASEITEQLSEIREAVSESKDISVAAPDRVPRSPEEKDAVMRERPPAWEFLLFASFLLQEKERLEMKWHDYNMPPFQRRRAITDVQEASAFLSNEFSNLVALVDALSRGFPREVQEEAFGAPGEPGDPVRIEHFAKRIIQTYEGMLDWAAEIREVEPPEVLREVWEVAPQMPKRPISEFRDFVDRVVREMDQLPKKVDELKEKDEPTVMTLDLNLELDDRVMEEFHRRMKRAHRKVKWGF
jgi:hypothetical protein